MLTIGIAGLSVAIDHRYPYLDRLCAGYETDAAPDFTVTVTEEMIAEERARATEPTAGATPGYLEGLAASREIARVLPSYDALLFHAAVIELHGEAIAFTAPSGTGKSTHIRNWRRAFGDEVGIVNGDKPILRFSSDGKLWAYGTPWSGKEGWNRNIGFPLRAVVFLARGKTDRAYPISREDAVLPLLGQVLLDGDPANVAATLELSDRMLGSVGLYRLECTPDVASAFVARDAVFGK